jgi:hypothetical protein
MADEPTPPASDSPAGNPPADPTSPSGDGGDGGASQNTLLSTLAEKGLDLGSKYDSDDALIQGLQNQQRMLGQRDEYAKLGRDLLQNIEGREEEFWSWMNGQQKSGESGPASTPVTGGDSGEAKDGLGFNSYEEYLLAQAQAQADGADPGLKDKVERAGQRLGKMLFQLASNPDEVLGDTVQGLEGTLEQRIQQAVQQAVGQGRQVDRAAELTKEHAQALFSDGRPDWQDAESRLTPFGQTVREKFAKLRRGGMGEAAAYEEAIEFAQAKLPRPGKTRPTTPQADRVPPAAAPQSPTAGIDLEKHFSSGGTLRQLAEKLSRAQNQE